MLQKLGQLAGRRLVGPQATPVCFAVAQKAVLKGIFTVILERATHAACINAPCITMYVFALCCTHDNKACEP